MEDDLNIFGKCKTTSIFWGNGRRQKKIEMEDDLKYYRIFGFKWKTPQFFVNKIMMQPETSKIKTMVLAPLRVT